MLRSWKLAGCVAAGLALLAARPAAADTQALYEAAKKEGTVVWYSSLIVNQILRPIAAAFEAKYPGVKLQYSRSTNSDIVLRLTNEARAGRVQGDVFDGSTAIFSLKDADLVEAYRPESAKHYPPELKDPDGYWTAMNLYFLTASYNTDMVKAADAPKTYQDLLDPKWKGKMAWTNDPTPNGPPGFIGVVLRTMGQEKGMDYLKKLAQQKIASVPASQRVVLDQVISGQYAIGLMTFNHHDAISAAKGAPVTWVKLDPVVATMSVMSIPKNAPHPNAAKLLVEFCLSPVGQKVLQDAFYLPADPDVPAKDPTLKPEGGHFKVDVLTPTEIHKHIAEWTKIYDDLFK